MPGIRGLTSTDDVLAHARTQIVAEGTGSGIRVLAVAPAGGLHSRILLDRGLDLGATWFGGEPVAWLSATGEHPPGLADRGEGWHDGWAGGLLTTCGLQNVGLPSEGHGRHGRLSDLTASDISINRHLDESGNGSITVTGRIHEPVGLGRGIEVRRRLTFLLGAGVMELEDVATNQSSECLQSPLLYHLNFGYPFLGPETTLLHCHGEEFSASTDSTPMGPPAIVPDTVTEHQPVIAQNGTAAVALRSATLGLQVTVTWNVDSLPRLFCWQRRAPGSYVCAIEPANCSVQGRAFDRGRGAHPELEPGASRRTWLRIAFQRLAEDDR